MWTVAGMDGVSLRDLHVPDLEIDGGIDAGHALLSLPDDERPDGVICVADLTGMAIVQVLSGAGVRVPDDLSVTGCDGIAPGLPLLGLATIRVPVETVARRGVEVMRQLMDAPEPVRARHELHRGYLIDGTTLSVPPTCGSDAAPRTTCLPSVASAPGPRGLTAP